MVERCGEPEGVRLGFAMNGRPALVVVDGWGGEISGLQFLDGKNPDANETKWVGGLLQEGAANKIICTVRRDTIRVTCNRNVIIDWKGDSRRLSLPSDWPGSEKPTLTIGTYTGFRFTRIR